MKNIEAVIRQFKLDDIKDALAAFGTQGLTIWRSSDLVAKGKAPRSTGGREQVIDFLPKVKLKLKSLLRKYPHR